MSGFPTVRVIIYRMTIEKAADDLETPSIIHADQLTGDHIRKYGALLPKVGNTATYVAGVIVGIHHEFVDGGFDTIVTLQLTNSEAVSIRATDGEIAVGDDLGPLIELAAKRFTS